MAFTWFSLSFFNSKISLLILFSRRHGILLFQFSPHFSVRIQFCHWKRTGGMAFSYSLNFIHCYPFLFYFYALRKLKYSNFVICRKMNFTFIVHLKNMRIVYNSLSFYISFFNFYASANLWIRRKMYCKVLIYLTSILLSNFLSCY